MKTVLELRDDRAQKLTEIDDILRTSKEAGTWTDEDRKRHDDLVAEIEGDDGLDVQIARATSLEADEDRLAQGEIRRARYATVNVNPVGGNSIKGDHTLDDLLWATDEVVRAGTLDKTGQMRYSGAVNQVEQVIMRTDDGYMRTAPRIDEFRHEDHRIIRTFQKTVADMILFGLLVDKGSKSSRDGFEVARSHKLFKDRWQHILRAMDTDTTAEGVEWVPTGIGADLHQKVRALGKVAPLFGRIDLPTNPWKWPIEGADATAYRVAEPTSDTATKVTASTPGTAAATYDAEIFGARSLFSRSLEADSALAILPYAQRKLVLAFSVAEERAILDGDSDGTHQDSDIGASTTDAVTAWDGLRKKAIAQTVATATTCTALNLGVVRKAMTKWGVNPADLAFIIGVSNLHTLLADTNLLTVDKMGPAAVILNGQIGSVFGVPVIVSEYVRENLNASGVYDGITTTKTYMLCVNRNEWVMGQRMGLDVEVDDSIYRETFQRVVVAFMREDFQNIGDAATNEDTAIAYNVTP